MRRVLILAALLLAVAALTYQGWDMFARPGGRVILQGTDDSHYYFWVRSAVVDGDWEFTNDVRDTPTIDADSKAMLLLYPRTPAGRQQNKYQVGWAVVSAPFFLLAHGLCLLGAAPADGWQPIYFVCIWAGHLVLAFFGLITAQRILRRFMPSESAWIGVLAGWLGSPLIYYQTARISMVHGAAFVLTVVAIEQAFRIRDGSWRRRDWFLLALASALLVITRPTSAVYLLGPAGLVITALWRAWRETSLRKNAMSRLALMLVTITPILFIQLFAWRRVYGSWLANSYGYGDESFHFSTPQFWSVLFSPQHGWFNWHPLLLPATVMCVWAAVRGSLPRSWLISLGLIIYLNAAWWCWWFASSFGNRGFEGATLYCMAGLGLIWSGTAKSVWQRRTTIGVIGLAIIANALLLGLFMTGKISRVEPVTYGDFFQALVGARK